MNVVHRRIVQLLVQILGPAASATKKGGVVIGGGGGGNASVGDGAVVARSHLQKDNVFTVSSTSISVVIESNR